ncbi:hypothetical protein BDN71DRAFT_1393527, partial [Pleurotus eryngii]
PFIESYGDIILCSHDGVDFHIYEGIVLVASTIFCDIFLLPDPPAANLYQGMKPIIHMEENSFVLDALLQFCYSMNTSKIYEKLHLEKISTAA